MRTAIDNEDRKSPRATEAISMYGGSKGW
uniref:Uncharacterized protein n=1 Tax=Arundo donax TaxID=35708 RepID=A0A0A9AJN9_ARUDO